MSKRLRITVNGQAYEVEVEEVGQAARPSTVTVPPVVAPPRPEPKPVINVGTQPKPATRPAAPGARPAAAASAPAGKGVITAPIPGVISEVKVTAGQKVHTRDILVLLEAMKMQNEIMAPHAGVVREVYVSSGANVSTGDKLVAIDPE